MGCEHPRTLTTFATLLSPIVIVFVIIAFATDHWVDTDVDRTKLDNIEITLSQTHQVMARFFFTRHKGIIRECYPSSSAVFLDQASNVVEGDCFYISFDDPSSVDMSSEYQRRMHLLRGILAAYVIGMVCIILTFFLGIGLCFAKHCHVAHAAAITSFVGATLLLSAMVLFHATEYVETNKSGDPGELVFHNTWGRNLQRATSSDLGYSYALSWVGIILAALEGILFLLAGRALRLKQIRDDTSSLIGTNISDNQRIMRRSLAEDKTGYDNVGAKIHGIPQSPMFYGYPTFLQSMPAMPSLTYGDTVYSMPENGWRSDA